MAGENITRIWVEERKRSSSRTIAARVVFTAGIATSLAGGGCQPATTSTVMFVDQSESSTNSDHAERENQLLLVVGIAEHGKLTLNNIDVGTTADLAPIREKLDAIFKDRARTGIDRKDVVIEISGNVRGEDFERLVKGLAAVRADPIQVVKGGSGR